MLLLNHELIPQLREKLKDQMALIQDEIEKIPSDSLNFRSAKGKWSTLECIDHLNMVFDLYIPRIERKLNKRNLKEKDSYSTGFFGDRMVSSMEPQKGEIKYPMKTFGNLKPERSPRNKKEVIRQFKEYINQLDIFLEQSEKLDLGTIRIKSAVGNILRFKLGDCYRFLIAHNERHLLQAKKVLRVLATYQ